MIIVITYWNSDTKQFLVSHGIDVDTMKHVTLPTVPLNQLDVVWNNNLMEWVLYGKELSEL